MELSLFLYLNVEKNICRRNNLEDYKNDAKSWANTMQNKLDILLTTYNGDRYLEEQLQSLFSQQFKEWQLLVRDDGSSDNTIAIIEKISENNPGKINYISDELGNVGPAQSFSILLGISEAPYVAFCDQDDIWLEDKLATQFAVMLDAEKTLTSDCPILIHSDLRVVDSNLNLLSDSLWNYQKLNPERMKLMQRMLIHNYVTGCASIINRKLIDISMPIPINVVMHDWWIALIAIARGTIISIPETTVLYRQHDENDTGAVNWSLKYFIKIIIKRAPKTVYRSAGKA